MTLAALIDRLTPLGDRLIVQQVEAPKQVGSIIVPDTAEIHWQWKQGEIVAAGELVRDRLLCEGARVIFAGHGHPTIDIDGIQYKVISEEQIEATLTEEAD